VNPGVPTATRDVFNRWSEGEKASQALAGPRQSVLHESLSQQSIADEPLSQDSTPQYAGELIAFLNKYCNDLTPAAIACTKVIDDVLNTLRALPNASLVRMSGSGSTCFALFTSTNAAMSAARALKVEHPNWWICATKIG
jgi:4-diphosphocytidyl-2C-methyl-D-erythritol kinase